MRLPRPSSLMGQMLLAVAVALLLVQCISAVLIYRAQRDSYENGMLNAAAFGLVSATRGNRPGARGPDRAAIGDVPRNEPNGANSMMEPPPRRFRPEYSASPPEQSFERRDKYLEAKMAEILSDQNFPVSDIRIVHRTIGSDPVARDRTRDFAARLGVTREVADSMMSEHLLVVGVLPRSSNAWLISRVRRPRSANTLLLPLIFQTLTIYTVLVGAVALILRRMTRPLAALTRRVEEFAHNADVTDQIEPSGPDDMRRLVNAHNAMEKQIASMLNEKDVMLGAIGHDLKTPLAALRVRIESVEDETERARMAVTIEDIVHTLDDILSLARVGRPSDPRERTELSALVASVVEEYEDIGEPVELVSMTRLAFPMRATWLRRALRNLIGNALRYGERARVTLQRSGNSAVILIEDDGPGIPDSAIEDMMNPFTRGDPSRNSATGGAGLGLALARAIADQHGGSLALHNRYVRSGAVAGLIARLEIPIG